MSLLRPLPDEFRPWYLLDAAAFLLGAAASLRSKSVDSVGDALAVSPFALLIAVTSGLFGVFVLRVTLGNLWGYAVEYVNAGGQWLDLPFLIVVGGGVVAAAITYVATASVGAAAWAGFWAFVAVAAVVAVAAHVAAGYGEAS